MLFKNIRCTVTARLNTSFDRGRLLTWAYCCWYITTFWAIDSTCFGWDSGTTVSMNLCMEMIMQWLTFRQILHFVVDNCIPSISKMKQSFPITNCPLVSNQQNKQKQRNEEQQTLPTTMYQPTWPSLYMIQLWSNWTNRVFFLPKCYFQFTSTISCAQFQSCGACRRRVTGSSHAINGTTFKRS